MCTYPVQPVCTSPSSLLFILLFIKSQYTVFAHLICFALFILLHILLFISLFYLYIYIYIYALVLCYFYLICILLRCPLSGPDLIYISLLIIPCIIYYVTNKETLTLICVIPRFAPKRSSCLSLWENLPLVRLESPQYFHM